MTGFYVTLPTLALAAFATTSIAQDAPAGAGATGCDVGSFSAVVSERTGEVLYWTNSTCPATSGPSDSPASDDAPAGLDMGDRNGSGSEGGSNGSPSVEEGGSPA